MEFKEYKEQVKRTLPSLGEFNGNLVILDSIHMVLGMNSEIYELEEGIVNGDEINVAEELTDIAWYACNYANVRGIILNKTLHSKGTEDTIDGMSLEMNKCLVATYISELQDYDKKELAYNKLETIEIKNSRAELINNIVYVLNACYHQAGIDAEKAMQNNIDKLRARFPDKFDEARANTRDLAAERKELEK